MIDTATRLRRAILLNDILLVKRLVRTHPTYLRNPDFSDKSNTSLHLAAKHGFWDIAAYLIDAGHEDEGISRNSDWDTPLMLACDAQAQGYTNAYVSTQGQGQSQVAGHRIEVAKLLIAHFPHCVPWTNKSGLDALMIASRSGALPLLPLLLTSTPPASPTAHDNDGNTALHHASAAGELKALRLLLQYGASPLAQNNYSWTPIAYSATQAAEVYFKQLVAEFEKRRVEALKAERERLESQAQAQSQAQQSISAGQGQSQGQGQPQIRPQRIGGVRLVTQQDDLPQFRPREDSLSNLQRPNVEWSPIERRAGTMTPTEGRSTPGGWNYGRGRASSGE